MKKKRFKHLDIDQPFMYQQGGTVQPMLGFFPSEVGVQHSTFLPAKSTGFPFTFLSSEANQFPGDIDLSVTGYKRLPYTLMTSEQGDVNQQLPLATDNTVVGAMPTSTTVVNQGGPNQKPKGIIPGISYIPLGRAQKSNLSMLTPLGNGYNNPYLQNNGDPEDQMLEVPGEDVNPLTGDPYPVEGGPGNLAKIGAAGNIPLNLTIDGTVVTADGQKGMTVLPPAQPGQLPVTNQGTSVDPTIKAPTPPVTTKPVGDVIEDVVAEKVNDAASGQNEGTFDPNAYYLFKGRLDTGALMRNMMQEPPPNMQMKMPHLNRIRMDRQPYDDARQQVREMGRASYRGAREGISQMSDFLKMSQAVTTGTQEQVANIGTAEAQQELMVDQQNQQIANQEAMMQSEAMNREMMANYQTQAEAQRYKDSMISHQLARIGDTAGAYAMYQNQKEQAMRQEEIQKKQANLANEMQLNWMKYEATKTELSSPSYAAAERQAVNNYIKESQAKLLEEDDFKVLNKEFGDSYDPSEATDRSQRYRKALSTLEYEKKNLTKPVKNQFDNDDDYNNAVAKYNEMENELSEFEKEVEKLGSIVEAEKLFYDRVQKEFDISGKRREFQSTYLQEAGLPSSAEFIQSVQSALEAYRQL